MIRKRCCCCFDGHSVKKKFIRKLLFYQMSLCCRYESYIQRLESYDMRDLDLEYIGLFCRYGFGPDVSVVEYTLM